MLCIQVLQSGSEVSSKGKGRKKLRKSEIESKSASVREVGFQLELWAVGSRSLQLSQSWLMMEAAQIHLLPPHYHFILKPEALELK